VFVVEFTYSSLPTNDIGFRSAFPLYFSHRTHTFIFALSNIISTFHSLRRSDDFFTSLAVYIILRKVVDHGEETKA
jgi:hypothetical protein